MVTQIVSQVMLDNSNRRVAVTVAEAKPKKVAPKSSAGATPKAGAKKVAPKKPAAPPAEANPDAIIGQPCPLCGKGHIIKGKTAYGCSEWKNGCTWRKAFK